VLNPRFVGGSALTSAATVRCMSDDFFAVLGKMLLGDVEKQADAVTEYLTLTATLTSKGGRQ
jgi:hypothetical protein